MNTSGLVSAADRTRRLLEGLLRRPLPLRLRAWDGSEAGPLGGPTLVVSNRRALRRLLWNPGELGLARAYVSGDIGVDGDLYEALEALSSLIWEPLPVRGKEIRAAIGSLLRLGVIGPPPPPPKEEITVSGARHSKARDRQAVSHHYDVGNDFYRLVLGPTMVYSCALWTSGEAPGYGLDTAQQDKLALICRKLELKPGQLFLDVGCGWGGLATHAARHHGVRVVGVTISETQAEYARKQVAEAGLSDVVEIRHQDYRDLRVDAVDAIASVGMGEHVGREHYADYARTLHGLLKPGGRLLNQQIASLWSVSRGSRRTFIDAYVFPDGELDRVGVTVARFEDAGFEVRSVEAMREHYGPTLRAWVRNLQDDWDRAVALTSPGRARVWLLYMAACALGFERRQFGVNQILAVRA
ncbi:class I SAM-dependent methyltransferase [Kibdelosporangium aridum]|uniref:Cyclopropane-fatty-acyl-phospholipid synthase n=1 Tax=Kibdelosporangium aridum TaxID=2030 RepID=A0A1Y5Y997_KIBAR|nr:class I SAM-dependent methyltransferase [Kibdelosporangium aridum]SMD26440.1 cyclopropane-fatty-acyl-phospholipid synthase [Kibdelosporangium aridum]